MFCKNCGYEIKNNLEICPKCGCRIKNSVKNKGCIGCILAIILIPLSLILIAWLLGVMAVISQTGG
jgi:uncharacterized membrane protein